MITHSVGTNRTHQDIVYIPEVELEWRRRMAMEQLSEDHINKFIKVICSDPLEIARRGLYGNDPVLVEKW